MKIDFGKIERYIEDRGFGFVSHTFVRSPSMEVFFHIKSVKRTCPDLAQVLNARNSNEPLYFWYEFGLSEKGQQVFAVLEPTKIRQSYSDDLSAFIDMINKNWMNVEMSLPESIRRATFDLLPPDEVRQLEAKREIFEEEKKRKREELQRIEAARLQEIADQKAAQEKIEEEEFRQLVAEMSPLGFTYSAQVSAYIVRHKLGYKYPNISGILKMEIGGYMWNFNGGFPTEIYAQLCHELQLENQKSRARAIAFRSYKDINKHQSP